MERDEVKSAKLLELLRERRRIHHAQSELATQEQQLDHALAELAGVKKGDLVMRPNGSTVQVRSVHATIEYGPDGHWIGCWLIAKGAGHSLRKDGQPNQMQRNVPWLVTRDDIYLTTEEANFNGT